MKHEAESKSNAYWLGLLAHLQASSIPRKVSRAIYRSVNYIHRYVSYAFDHHALFGSLLCSVIAHVQEQNALSF